MTFIFFILIVAEIIFVSSATVCFFISQRRLSFLLIAFFLFAFNLIILSITNKQEQIGSFTYKEKVNKINGFVLGKEVILIKKKTTYENLLFIVFDKNNKDDELLSIEEIK